jgi:hypothetical protein
MIRKIGDSTEIQEKRQADDHRKLGSRLIDAETEKRLIEVGGFSRKQLYNRRGGPAERGLCTLLEKDDQIVEVLPGQVKIKTREGTIQTYYNLEAAQDFLRPDAPGKS